MDETDIREHREVFSSDRQWVGVVEAVQGQRVRLTRT